MNQKDIKRISDKAVALAERQIDDGTATPSVISHFLRLATERERQENLLLEAKVNKLNQDNSSAADVSQVLEALSGYRGE